MADEVVKPLNLDKILARRAFNRIALLGVELEGGWATIPAKAKIERDGSVFKEAGDDGALKRSDYPGEYFGEIPVGPMQRIQLASALKKYYPSRTNSSCGMHVHMSFDKVIRYVLLADSPAYQETVIEYMTQWAREEKLPPGHTIWPRLKGDNEYCQKKFWPTEQMKKTRKEFEHNAPGHRYTVINYAWEKTRTVECRLLPMLKDHEQAFRAISRLLDVTNAYLVAAENKRVKLSGKTAGLGTGSRIKLELRKGEVYEEFYEED